MFDMLTEGDIENLAAKLRAPAGGRRRARDSACQENGAYREMREIIRMPCHIVRHVLR